MIWEITGLQENSHHKDAATKFYIDNSMVLKADISYVDNEVAKNLGAIDLTSYLKRDGSVKMISDLDLNNNLLITLNQPNLVIKLLISLNLAMSYPIIYTRQEVPLGVI